MKKLLLKAIEKVPAVIKYLDPGVISKLRQGERKTYDYMLRQIEGLVRGVYEGNIGGQFIDTMANLISGQLTQAYQQAYEDEGYTDYFLPGYLQSSLDEMILKQYTFVDQYYRDIVDARVDATSVQPLLSRAALWAQRWTEAYNEAKKLISLESGGNMVWTLGATETHCYTCISLDGIVASAKEWKDLNVKPQNAPNNKLDCRGWYCDCSLTPTDKRRSPGAYGKIEAVILNGR